MRKLTPLILLLVITLSLITPISPAIAGNIGGNLTPKQVTNDLNLTKAGGWYREFPFNTQYIDEWGFDAIYRYPVSQFMGGYFTWDSAITDPYGIGDNTWYASDGFLTIYSYGFDAYTSLVEVFFDNYSIAPAPYDFTFDVVTDIVTAPYNETYDAAYWVAMGYDYGAELVTGGIPVFYSGVYAALTDGDFLVGDVGPGYFDFDLPTARALFGGDNNVTGIALTTLTVADGLAYTGGFYVYNDTANNATDMPPIIVVFNATDLSLVSANIYPSAMWINSTFLPSRMIYYNGSIYMIGYREEYYAGYGKLLDYILIYQINATPSNLTIEHLYAIPAFTGGYIGSLPKFIPFLNEYPISFFQKLDAVLDNETGILYIAATGFDQNGDVSAYIVAFNITSGSIVWRNLIGADNSVDFAGGIDLVTDYKGGKYIVVNGALNYTVSENLTGYNVFYALLDADTGNLEYLYVVGGKGADLGFDLGQIVYYSPEGPVIRPYYTALTTNSTDFWIRDVTSLYNSGVLNTTGIGTVKFKAAPITPSTTMKLSARVKPAGHSMVVKRLGDEGKQVSITSHQPGYMAGGLLQPALPPATTLIVTHEPERAILWNETTTYVLINITARLLDNWTGNPISGEEVWLYVSGPNITYHRNATAVTNDTGYAVFQYNATQPGTYTFEVMFPGTAFHFRAFEFFQIFLSSYRTIVELYTNATSIYTLFERPAKLSGIVYIKNGTRLVPFNHTTVIIDVYLTPLLSYLFFGDYDHTGWLWDQGFYIPEMVLRTNDTGGFEFVLTNTTIIGSVMYSYRSDILENQPSYLFRAVVLANETVVTPENTSNTVQVYVEPTPTRIEVINAPANGTTIRAGNVFNVTVRWVWSHDGFVTVHPIAGEPVAMIYDAKDAGIQTLSVEVTDANGYATFTVSSDTLGTLCLNFTNYYTYYTLADALTVLEYTVAPAGINVTVTLPPSNILTIDDYKVIVHVVDNETGEPKPDVAVWVFINGTATLLTTDLTGTAVYTHDFPADSWIKPGLLNITVVVNGTVYVGGALVKTYNVTIGERTEASINVAKTPTYIYVTAPTLVNATQDYQITPYLIAYNSTGYGFSFTGVTLGVTTDYGVSTTATTGSAVTIPGTPDAGNYTLTLSWAGNTYLAPNTTSITIQAKWLTRLTILSITAEAINNSYAKVTMQAKVERYYFNETTWKPMPGVTVKFYYVGSIGVFATNTTDANGVATGTGVVPRHNIQAFGASALSPAIQPSSSEKPISALPGDVILAVLPAPEPPILPIILLAAILLFIIVKKRK